MPVMRMEPGRNPEAEGTWSFGTESNPTAFQVSTTSGVLVPRVEVRAAGAEFSGAALTGDGGIAFGPGSSAPTRAIRNFGAGIAFDATHVSWMQHNTYDVGLSVNRPRTVRVGTATVVGVFTTAGRNALGAAHAATGAGACVYDSTLNRPVWSDGANWRDAAGTVV